MKYFPEIHSDTQKSGATDMSLEYGTKEHWEEIGKRLEDRENRKAAAYRLSSIMYDVSHDDNYIRRDGQARRIVNACGADKLDQIIALVKEGKQESEIISVLKKNDAGFGPPSP